jgi:hypothetical protein
MSLDIEVRLLLNNLIKKHYDYFKVLEKSFSRYIVDQHKHYSEYPDEPPFYLISTLYELDRIVIDYCEFGAARIVNAHDACSDMIKYKFWLYYNMHYSDYIDDRIIVRFNKVVDKCITILKLNDEIVSINCNPMCNMFSSKS